MEKKKILLVAVSVGVFLVIIISASILIFTPKTGGAAVASARPIPAGGVTVPIQPGFVPELKGPASVDAADMVRNAADIQGIQTPPQATAIQETNFYINGEKPLESYEITKTDGGAAARVVINVPKPSTAAVPDVQTEAPARPAQAAPAAVAARPARTQSAAAKPAETAAPAPAKTAVPAAKPAVQTKTYNDYWVQTGAFSAKVRAEAMKNTLSSKGITSIIENREVDGKTWYRVRVGPYTSENEANYWASLVKSIDGFGDSQVRLTKSQR
ncbi:MAG: SPOR domain-containing protein [Treponema sp.]|jgi:DedD protein|nr:SPOR domain-containing protein [Treponema sp.]